MIVLYLAVPAALHTAAQCLMRLAHCSCSSHLPCCQPVCFNAFKFWSPHTLSPRYHTLSPSYHSTNLNLIVIGVQSLAAAGGT